MPSGRCRFGFFCGFDLRGNRVDLGNCFVAGAQHPRRCHAANRAKAQLSPTRLLLTSIERKQKTPSDQGFMAVTVGFEPTVGGYPTQLFESCTFGRSDTSPPK